MKGDNSDEDSDSDDGKVKGGDDDSDENEDAHNAADGGYKLGSTSGSKLVDRMRKQQAAAAMKASQKSVAAPVPSPASTTMGSWSGNNNNAINNGLGISNPFGGGNNAFGGMNSPAFPFQQGGGNNAGGSLSPFASPMLTPSLNAPSWQQSANSSMPSASFPGFGGMSPVPPTNAMAAPVAAAPAAMLSQSAPASLQQSFAAVATPAAPSAPAPSTPSFRAGTNLAAAPAAAAPIAAAAMPFPSFAPPAGGNPLGQSNAFGQPAQGLGGGAMANPFGGTNGNIGMSSTFPASMPSSFPSSFPASSTMAAPAPVAHAPVKPHPPQQQQQQQQAQHHHEDNDNDDEHNEEEDAEGDNNDKDSDSHHSHTTIDHGKTDWHFDPIEDMKMPSFTPAKSLRDEDWKEHDEKFANSNGVENSYGIKSIVADEPKIKAAAAAAGVSSSSPSRPYTPIIFSPGHVPATPGTPESIPMKSALSSKSHFNKKGISMSKAGSKKSLRFGENVVQTYDNTFGLGDNNEEEYSLPTTMHPIVVEEEEEDVNKNLLTAALSDAAEEKAMYEKRISSSSNSPPPNTAASNVAFGAQNNAFGGFGGGMPSIMPSQAMPFAANIVGGGNPFGSFPQSSMSSAFGGSTTNNNPFGSMTAAVNPFGGSSTMDNSSLSAPSFMQQQPNMNNSFTPQAPAGPKPTSPGGMSRRMSWLADNNLIGPQAGLIASSTLAAEEEIAKTLPPSTRVSLDLSSFGANDSGGSVGGPSPLVSTTNMLNHGSSFFPGNTQATGMNSTRVSFDQQSTMFAASNAPSMRNSVDLGYAHNNNSGNDVRSALVAVQSLNPFTPAAADTVVSAAGNGKRVSFDLMNTNNMSMNSAIETAVNTANKSETATAPAAAMSSSSTFEGYSLPSSSMTVSTPFAAAQTVPVAMNAFESSSNNAPVAAASFGGFPSSSSFGMATPSAASTAFGSAPSFPSFGALAAAAAAPFGGDSMGGMSMQAPSSFGQSAAFNQQQQSFGQPQQSFAPQSFGQAFGQQQQQSFGQAALGSSLSFPIPAAVNTMQQPQQSQHLQSPVTIKPSPRSRSYAYGEGDAVDLSMEYAETRSQSTTDESAASRKLGPNWDLALFRISNLSNVEETLEFLLQDEELFECAELYISTIGSLHNQHDEEHHDHGGKPFPLTLCVSLDHL